MKTIIIRVTNVFFLLGFSFFISQAQDPKTAKKEFSAGTKLAKEGQHAAAIEAFSRAMTADSKFADAYIARAGSYELTKNWPKAVEDYKAVFGLLDPADKQLKDLNYSCGRDYTMMQEYKQAIAYLDKAITLDNRFLAAYQERALCRIKLKNFTGAVEDCDKAIEIDKNSHTTYFYKACAADSLVSNQLAEMLYQKAITLMIDQKSKKDPVDPVYKFYFINLGLVQKELGKHDDAIKNFTEASILDQKDDKVYAYRGSVYGLKGDFTTAIADLTKAIVLNEKNVLAFLERGFANKKIGQFQNAITDFTRAIVLSDNEPKAYSGRGSCYFEIAKYSESLKDLERAAILAPADKEIGKYLADTKQRIYELNRESNIPTIFMLKPESNDKNKVNIPDNARTVTFTGKIKDESGIKSVTIDGEEAKLGNEESNPSFTITLPVVNKQQITVHAVDIYNNKAVEIFILVPTETNPPVVRLNSPVATPDMEIYLSSENPNIYFEGEITDASYIRSVTVEGLVAAFNPGEYNPKFNTNLNILNKDTIHITVVDVHGNTGQYNYFIDREASAAALSNPMGRTWAVFVDNTNYTNLPSLQGTTADVSKMRAALAQYRIDKTIVKKDLSKTDMEKFFSIELRDMLRDNQINSVLVWYSGHGKFMNDVGYWIPVDAVRDDEFTYFSLNVLKASLQSYKNVTHHLVISDACETGPAFYLAMRDAGVPKECGQWDYAKYRSAQVLTSSNKEKSSDNSLFATTFASSLSSNESQCVSIETIAERVKSVVKKNQAQTPKFGNITGIDDAGGTFFFIKK